jgi:hypothetical protein
MSSNISVFPKKLIFTREMLTSALRALYKKFKVEILFWDLCIEHIEASKSNFFYMKAINCFRF